MSSADNLQVIKLTRTLYFKLELQLMLELGR